MTDKQSEPTVETFEERAENINEVAETLQNRHEELRQQKEEEQLEQYKQEQREQLEEEAEEKEAEEEQQETPSYPSFLEGRALGIENLEHRDTYHQWDETEENLHAFELVVDTIRFGEMAFRIVLPDGPENEEHEFNRLLDYQNDSWENFNPSQWEKPIYLKQTSPVPEDVESIERHYKIEYPPKDTPTLQMFYKAYCWYSMKQTYDMIEDNQNNVRHVRNVKGQALLSTPIMLLSIGGFALLWGSIFSNTIATAISVFLFGAFIWSASMFFFDKALSINPQIEQ